MFTLVWISGAEHSPIVSAAPAVLLVEEENGSRNLFCLDYYFTRSTTRGTPLSFSLDRRVERPMLKAKLNDCSTRMPVEKRAGEWT